MVSHETLERAAIEVIQILKNIDEFSSAQIAVLGGMAIWKYLPFNRTTNVLRSHAHCFEMLIIITGRRLHHHHRLCPGRRQEQAAGSSQYSVLEASRLVLLPDSRRRQSPDRYDAVVAGEFYYLERLHEWRLKQYEADIFLLVTLRTWQRNADQGYSSKLCPIHIGDRPYRLQDQLLRIESTSAKNDYRRHGRPEHAPACHD